mmetsp:Transcript_8910/g.19411  ORF Transcript_8910/g.19411 Transcript_8910/m.19411 type:complete len:297 (-) Transcript_8910:203-1093(-)
MAAPLDPASVALGTVQAAWRIRRSSHLKLEARTVFLYARTGTDGDVAVEVALSDGERSWQGCLAAHELTKPKLWRADRFVGQLLDGLVGAPGSSEDEISISLSAPCDSLQLSWGRTSADPLIEMRLRQEIRCERERPGVSGEVLRRMLATVRDEALGKQRLCEEQVLRSARLQEERRQLEAARAHLDRMRGEMLGSLRAKMLEEINRTKRRAAEIDDALQQSERGEGDVSDATVESGSDTEDEDGPGPDASGVQGESPSRTATEQTPLQASPLPPASSSAVAGGDYEDDVLELLEM